MITVARVSSESTGSGLGQTFQGAPVQAGNVHPAAEVGDRRVGSLGHALGNDWRDGGLTDGLDGGQADAQLADLSAVGWSVDGVMDARAIHVRQLDADASYACIR